MSSESPTFLYQCEKTGFSDSRLTDDTDILRTIHREEFSKLLDEFGSRELHKKDYLAELYQIISKCANVEPLLY